VSANGFLKVSGNKLVNEHGTEIQLRGMSSHGLQWDVNLLNGTTTTWLKEDWGVNVVRAAMYIEEGGYKTNSSVKDKVYAIVDAAIANDIYVIVDWHILQDKNPQTNKALAKTFFEEVTTKYGNKANIIYEIANEPNGNDVKWNTEIRPYAEEIIPVIRAKAPKNLVVVGTGTWSQDVHDAANNPVTDSNSAYVVHFYACTHGSWLRDRIDTARSKNVAVFISEWGTGDASGAGSVCETQTRDWVTYLNNKKISWVNWSVANKNEATAAFKTSANMTRRWTQSDLSTSGVLVMDLMKTN
jgi:endoglucanase